MFSASTVANDLSQKRAAPSIISNDVVIAGVLQSEGDLQIDCRLEGNVRANTVMIGEDAQIHGDVQGQDVTVRGKVSGSIRANRITLSAGCHVEGDIVHHMLEVEFGAFIQGQVRHSADPLAEMLPMLEAEEEPGERRHPDSPMRGGAAAAAELPDRVAVNG